MAPTNNQPPAQRKDGREWTTAEQKAHLQSRLPEYRKAREKKASMRGWYSKEFQTYFDLFPTQPVTEKEEILSPGLTMEQKRVNEENQVRNWFKNHGNHSPTAKNERGDIINLDHQPKQLSDAQHFSKLYYLTLYKEMIRSKWRNTYIPYYRREMMKEGSSYLTTTELNKEIEEAIRTDIDTGVLCLTVSTESGVEGDAEEEEGHEDVEDGDQDRGPSLEEVPSARVPLWYQNAVMNKAWSEASPEQKDEVEERKIKHRMMAVNKTGVNGLDDPDQREVTLQCIIAGRAIAERRINRMLDQIFDSLGLVGSVCLAGPDPHYDGKLMSMSIHKQCADGQNLSDVYPDYNKAVADPMRAYAMLFFHKNISFLLCEPSLTTSLARDERHKWSLPQSDGGQGDFAALSYAAPAVKAIATATTTMPSVSSSPESSTMAHAAIRHDSPTSGQVDPLPSPSRSSSIHGGLGHDADSYIQTPGITSSDLQDMRLAEEGNSMAENDGEEMGNGEDISERLDDGVNEASTREEATQPANTANSTGGDVAEGRETQTTPSASPIPARNKNTMSLEQRPVTRTTSRTETTAPSRPTRSKKFDASGGSGPSTHAPLGNSRKRGRERGGDSEPPSKRPVTRSSQVKSRKRK